MKHITIIIFLAILPMMVTAQENSFVPGGFIRSGAYFSTDDYHENVNALFGDAALTLDLSDNASYKGFADIRIRTGRQFGEQTDELKIHEAWVTCYNTWLGISAGKKIVKWGKTDFFTPLSEFNPADNLYRSPDHEDTDLGNLLAEVTLTLSPSIRVSLVTAPLWNPSVLITRPLDLPDYLNIVAPEGLQSGNRNYSAGIRSDIMLRGTDIGIQLYHGPDPMPALALTQAALDDPENIYIEMTGVPYIINSAGIDFERVVSALVIRGSLSYTKPVDDKKGNEYVPFPQTEWVCGMDWMPGSFRITAEYYGKSLSDFYPAEVESLVGREIDFAQVAQEIALSGLTPDEYMRLQTEGFNRLFNYQTEKVYHAAGMRIEYEAAYGRIIPGISAMYNFTSGDLFLMPEIRYKPSDGITIAAGMEYYSGRESSLYEIIEEFMSALFISLRIDF